jgi:Fur family ferric uptake transcriptional regulator
MKNKNYRVSRATLYNTIELLLKCNLVVKHQFGKSFAQFEKAFLTTQHDHMICMSTGEVIEFSDPRLQKIINDICKKYGFVSMQHSLYIYGEKNNKQLQTLPNRI